jgi:uncharacterized protein YgiM (DUF1202 family)
VALQQAGILKGSDQFNPATLPAPNVTLTTDAASPNSSSQTVAPLPTPIAERSDLLSSELRAVINDPDGYTNVRSGQGASYGIIARINEGEVFYAIP